MSTEYKKDDPDSHHGIGRVERLIQSLKDNLGSKWTSYEAIEIDRDGIS